MIGIYFSGTGNSRYALEVLAKALDPDCALFSIEDDTLVEQLHQHEEILFSYPVQYSAVPKIVSDFVHRHRDAWQGKRVFVVATMALFSGDGAGVLARMLKRYGAVISGGLHLQMPDSIADEKVLKRSYAKNTRLVERATRKATTAAALIRSGRAPQEGLGILSRVSGLLTQRLWFGHKTQKYSDQLKIDPDKCKGCSKCARMCPTGNIVMTGRKATGKDRCTLCYRCVNLCPQQAITLLGKAVIKQTSIDRYVQ